MKATELMVGDYVIRKNVPKEILIVDAIESIRDIVYLDLDGLGITEKLENIEPIPLTQKILERNEFYYESNVGQVWNDGECEVIVDLYDVEIRVIKNRKEILSLEYFDKIYVHELQHALRLCGIDKEIKI